MISLVSSDVSPFFEPSRVRGMGGEVRFGGLESGSFRSAASLSLSFDVSADFFVSLFFTGRRICCDVLGPF